MCVCVLLVERIARRLPCAQIKCVLYSYMHAEALTSSTHTRNKILIYTCFIPHVINFFLFIFLNKLLQQKFYI